VIMFAYVFTWVVPAVTSCTLDALQPPQKPMLSGVLYRGEVSSGSQSMRVGGHDRDRVPIHIALVRLVGLDIKSVFRCLSTCSKSSELGLLVAVAHDDQVEPGRVRPRHLDRHDRRRARWRRSRLAAPSAAPTSATVPPPPPSAQRPSRGSGNLHVSPAFPPPGSPRPLCQ
jgi:hypothetical protein